jgi:integrase
MPRQKLTDRTVQVLAANGAGPVEHWDTNTPGLCLRVGATTKVWYVRYRFGGTHRRMKLGAFPRLSLADAREKARDALAAADAGEDPAARRAERRDGSRSVATLCAEVLEARRGKVREVTRQEYERLIARDVLPVWGAREAASVTRRDVVELVEAVARRAPVAGNRVLAVIRIIWNEGLRRGFPGVENNPAHLVTLPTVEAPRERYLTRKELRRVWQATEDEALLPQALVRLALLTGQRAGSLTRLRWQDITGDVWTIPAEHFKGKRPHVVPLSAAALDVLAAVPHADEDDVWAFPARAGSAAPHWTNLGKLQARIRRAAKVDGWTLHDCRRTMRTWCVRHPEDGGLGLPGPHVDAVLGHREGTIGAAVYTGDRASYLLREKREVLDKWGRFVLAAVNDRGA